MRWILLTLMATVGLCGCASTKVWMWQPLPQQIVVKTDTRVKGDLLGTHHVVLPAGTYTLWKTNEDGPIYRTQTGTIHFIEIGKKDTDIPGGIMLFNKFDVAWVVKFQVDKLDPNKTGELAAYVLNKDIEKNGYAYMPIGQLTADQREMMGLPRKNRAP